MVFISPCQFLHLSLLDVNSFRFKKPEERQVLHNIMQVLLPQLYARIASLIDDSSQMSVEIQKQILKIFFALIQVSAVLSDAKLTLTYM